MSQIVAGRNVALFGHMTVLCKFLLYIFPMVMFVTSGKMIRIIILVYCVISTYDMMTSLAIKLSWYFYVALLSRLYLGRYLLEFINNCTQVMGKGGGIFVHLITGWSSYCVCYASVTVILHPLQTLGLDSYTVLQKKTYQYLGQSNLYFTVFWKYLCWYSLEFS